MNPPLCEQPLTTSAPESAAATDRKRAWSFRGSSFCVVRLEELREITNLKADLVACYRPVNSQEMFAVERMAIAQQMILRAARLDAGLFTSAMNDVLDRTNEPIIPMDVDMVGDGDIEITRAQNRNYCIAEGFRRIAKESNLMTLAIRYRVQAERDYRRALEEFQRLERLRPKLPNEPDLLTDTDAPDDVAPLKEINRWIREEPVKEVQATKIPEPQPATTVVDAPSEPPSGNFPVAATGRSPRGTGKRANTNAQPRPMPAIASPLFRVGNTDSSKASVRREKHRKRSIPVPFSSPKPGLLPPLLEHNQPKPPQ